MVNLNIEDYIYRELSLDEQKIALEFTSFLKDKNLTFHKDNCERWKNKIYYWVKSEDKCVCFISIKDPDEANNHWTIWSDDMSDGLLTETAINDNLKEIAWKYVDRCGYCGSCGGGRHKNIFGKEFDDVCGCTFRIDNPTQEDLPFLKKIVEIRIGEIRNNN